MDKMRLNNAVFLFMGTMQLLLLHLNLLDQERLTQSSSVYNTSMGGVSCLWSIRVFCSKEDINLINIANVGKC